MPNRRPPPKEVATVTEAEVSRRCGNPAPPQLRVAVAQFNRGEFWECHETLEMLWLEEPDAFRVLYKGILHVGVGLLHLRNENLHGAAVKLSSGVQMLQPFRPRCLGLEIGRLAKEAGEILDRLYSIEPRDLWRIAREPPPQLHG